MYNSTQGLKQDFAQWNNKYCKTWRKERKGWGRLEKKKEKKKQPIWCWPSSEIHTAFGIYFQS